MISAVMLSMKSAVVRVALCRELAACLAESRGKATLLPPQFDLLVRLVNAALKVPLPFEVSLDMRDGWRSCRTSLTRTSLASPIHFCLSPTSSAG